MNEITKPAMANPRGLLNIPIKENNAPRNHNTQLTTGTQDPRRASHANINPANPSPLLFPFPKIIYFLMKLI